MKVNRIAITIILLLFANSSFSQWTEKWPVNINLTPENFLSTFLKANFGKIGEIASHKLDEILSDPTKQAKLAASTIKSLEAIYAKYTSGQSSSDAAAAEFVRLVSNDITLSTTSAPSGNLHIVVSNSPKFGVNRLSWDRKITRNSCQRFVCSCPDGSSRPGPGYYCTPASPNASSLPASCSIVTDILDIEAGYQVSRNSKVIANFAESRTNASGSTLSIGGTIGPISISLTGTLPPKDIGLPSLAGPFYDFDPQNEPIGTPLAYRVMATSSGCGNYAQGQSYNNYFTGLVSITDSISVDGNGDGRPDFISAGNFFLGRAEDAFDRVTVSANWNAFRSRQSAYAANIGINLAGSSPTGIVDFYVNGQLAGSKSLVSGMLSMPVCTIIDCTRAYNDAFVVVPYYRGDAQNPPGKGRTIYVQFDLGDHG